MNAERAIRIQTARLVIDRAIAAAGEAFRAAKEAGMVTERELFLALGAINAAQENSRGLYVESDEILAHLTRSSEPE